MYLSLKRLTRPIALPVKRRIDRIIDKRLEWTLSRFQKPYIKRKCIEGVCFDFLIGDQDGMDWYDTTCTDPFWPEMRLIRDHIIAPGDVVLEAGGHQGCTGILLSNWVGDNGTVITFEPNPNNVRILKTNIELNKIHNVVIENRAVGDRKGKIHLATETSNSYIKNDGLSDSIEVEMVTLDDYIECKPTVLKLDVEGADVLALRGAKNILKTRPKLAIEIHRDALAGFGTSLDELFRLIDVDSYQCWMQWNYEDDIREWNYSSQADRERDYENIVHGSHLFAIPKK